MHLSAIRVRGFKSFRDPLELSFEPGVSVVVGPNGSGKSNIADALQWAMASQPPSQLRAQTGQDVLFAGSEQHAASGVCEVELVIDNSDGRVGIARNELSVMRRLDRAGDSDYLLNRQAVRRLDVRDLLAEAGLGRDLHCIIAQGTVDQVLLARPDERRGLVEEAAGLGKFKRRRQRAEAKLARVAADLERAGDVERELRARLRPLELQATAAERAAALGRQIAEARLRLLASALAETRRTRSERENELVAARKERDAASARLAEITARRAEAEAELAAILGEQERAAAHGIALATAAERLTSRREALAQRLNDVSAEAARERELAGRLASRGRLAGAAGGRRDRGGRAPERRRGRACTGRRGRAGDGGNAGGGKQRGGAGSAQAGSGADGRGGARRGRTCRPACPGGAGRRAPRRSGPRGRARADGTGDRRGCAGRGRARSDEGSQRARGRTGGRG